MWDQTLQARVGPNASGACGPKTSGACGTKHFRRVWDQAYSSERWCEASEQTRGVRSIITGACGTKHHCGEERIKGKVMGATCCKDRGAEDAVTLRPWKGGATHRKRPSAELSQQVDLQIHLPRCQSRCCCCRRAHSCCPRYCRDYLQQQMRGYSVESY